jgi:pimeloyl-ACP methyl ester carboxylesterase
MKKRLDDNARKQAPGSFVSLKHGKTHFQWHGPENGKILVLVHGFSTPSFVWRGLLPPLINAGFRILTYDHYGRGWSDRPNGKYSLKFYRNHLLELLESQAITAPVHLCGYSMGGLIVADFAGHHRKRMDQIYLIAPAGLKASLQGVPGILKWPIIGSWLAEHVWSKRLLEEMQKPENQGKALPDLMERYQEQMAFPGYMHSLRSTALHMPLLEGVSIYEKLADTDISVSAIWGAKDTTTPSEGAETLKSLFPDADIEIFDPAYHAITYSHAEVVADHMIKNLKVE